jgi:hypothetical protein
LTIAEPFRDNPDDVRLTTSVHIPQIPPNTPADVKQRAMGLIYSMPVQLTAAEVAIHERVRSLIQGNAKPGQHAKDALHLVESAKYGCRFITNDRRLLTNRHAWLKSTIKMTNWIEDRWLSREGRGPDSDACACRLNLGELGKTRLGHHKRATANMAAQE